MEPRKRPVRVAFISLGSVQLLVGPASSLRREQMKVRSSTRATSLGSELARKQLGRFSGFSRLKVPVWTIRSHRASYSDWVPSHQCTESGWQRSTISWIQAKALGFLTQAGGFREGDMRAPGKGNRGGSRPGKATV